MQPMPPEGQGGYARKVADTAAECNRLKEVNVELLTALEGLVGALDDLINESRGVDGLHLNGNLAPWDSLLPGGQFEDWLMPIEPARAVLKAHGKPPESPEGVGG